MKHRIETVRLYDLADEVVDSTSSWLGKDVKRAGYDVTPRMLINAWNCWGLTSAEFVAELADGGLAEADLGEVDLEPSEQAALDEARAAVAEARAAKGGGQ